MTRIFDSGQRASTSRATARPTMPAPMMAKSWCSPAGPGSAGERDSLVVIRSVGRQRADGRGDAVHGGDDLLLEHVGEWQRDAGGGDPADGGIQQLESLVGDDGGDGAAPAALVGIFLDDEQP